MVMSAYAEQKRKPMPFVMQSAIERLGDQIVVVPCNPNGLKIYGENGVLQASGNKEQVVKWVESYQGCILSMIPRRSRYIAFWQSWAHIIDDHTELSAAMNESQKIEIDEYYSAKYIDQVGMSGRVILLPCQDGDHDTIPAGIYGGRLAKGIKNSGLIVLDHSKPVPLGGQEYSSNGKHLRASWE